MQVSLPFKLIFFKNNVITSLVVLFTPFCFNRNIALYHNQIWQCNGIMVQKSAFITSSVSSLTFRALWSAPFPPAAS